MRRMILAWSIIFLIISVALVSYGKMEKTAISKDNLADLKGKWTGTRTLTGGRGGMQVSNTDLEISSDGLPVQGKIIFQGVVRRGGSETVTIDFKGGKINDQGNLVITGPNIEVELTLSKDGVKMQLEGSFFWAGAKGTLLFKK